MWGLSSEIASPTPLRAYCVTRGATLALLPRSATPAKASYRTPSSELKSNPPPHHVVLIKPIKRKAITFNENDEIMSVNRRRLQFPTCGFKRH